MTHTAVPFLDLVSTHAELEDQLVEAFRERLRTASFIGGPAVEDFEREFARFCDVEHAVGVSSGTDALRFALIAAGIGPGHVVLTVPNTFAATVEAILQAGATPRFVDVDPRTSNMDPAKVREFLEVECRHDSGGLPVHQETGQAVSALMPVHLYGQMCDMDALQEIAAGYGLLIFEDACQAHGAEAFSTQDDRWRRAGSIGKAAGFSFYPGKNLGACGEGGAVTTNDASLAERARMLRDHGQDRKYAHRLVGYNGRLDAVQASMLSVKLPLLEGWNESRREAAARYGELLDGMDGLRTPYQAEWSRSVHHLYVIHSPDRDGMQAHLTECGIGTGLHYPIPLHLQVAFKHFGYQEGDFPVTERLAGELLSLPMGPSLDADQQARVVEAIETYLETRQIRETAV